MYWFKRIGWIYLPASAEGFMVTALAVFFLVPVFIAIVRNGHSVSDDLYHMFVYASCTAFWWKWIAEKTSTAQHENSIDR
jgi:hypothetical protein